MTFNLCFSVCHGGIPLKNVPAGLNRFAIFIIASFEENKG